MENTEESDKSAIAERGMHQKNGAYLNDELKSRFSALRYYDQPFNYSHAEHVFDRARWIVVEFGYMAHQGVLCVDYLPSSSESRTIDEMCRRLDVPRPSRS